MNSQALRLPDVTFAVDKVKADEFATALGTRLATDVDGTPLVPIGMLFFVLCRDSAMVFEQLGLRWERGLFGGVRFAYARQVRVGEQLLARSHVRTYYERETPKERLGFLDLETSYYDGDGQLVVQENSTVIARGGLELS
ncbi:MAG: MaoC family dehydratase N-terminal domain-containing protein [Ktedonobacteraceae bacterium]|nr:MaoC family dehydratase N-terminal domain-containing protein [Ktedonobacteraceae bacterium]